jgi:hypothetical protein
MSDYSTSWQNVGNAKSTTVFGAAKAGTSPAVPSHAPTDVAYDRMIAENVVLAAIIGDGDSQSAKAERRSFLRSPEVRLFGSHSGGAQSGSTGTESVSVFSANFDDNGLHALV